MGGEGAGDAPDSTYPVDFRAVLLHCRSIRHVPRYKNLIGNLAGQKMLKVKKLIQLCLCLVIVVLGVSGCSSPTPEDIVKKADSFMAANKPEEAIILLQMEITENPEIPLLKFKLAETYYRSGKHIQLLAYLESESLDASFRPLFYFLLSNAAREEENWPRVIINARRGLKFAEESCSGFYFQLQDIIVDAELAFENIDNAELSMKEIVSFWDNLACEDQRSTIETLEGLSDTIDFELLQALERSDIMEIEWLSKKAGMYLTNSRIVANASQGIGRIRELRSAIYSSIESCKLESRSNYELEWANACSNEAERKTREIRVCIHNNLPRAKRNYRNDRQANEVARDYCEALHGQVDNSKNCRLPISVANRLEGRMGASMRECEQILND